MTSSASESMAARCAGWRGRALDLVALLGFALAVTVWFTWPLAARLDRLGRVDSGDGQLSIWNVAWVARALVTDPLRVYDANIFHPHRKTLAFSEANLGAGVLAAPAYWLSDNAFVAHNVAVLLSFVLTLITTYGLVRYLTKCRGAALTSAVLFAFCPYLFARTAHIQLLMVFGLPLALLAMHRFVDRPTAGRMVALGGAVALQGLFCGYYGVLAGMLVGAGILFYGFCGSATPDPTTGAEPARRPGHALRYWLFAAGAAAVAGLLVWPFFLPYRELQATAGFVRPLGEAERYSADWRAYLVSNSHWHTWMLPLVRRWKEVLFPGFFASAFGLAALIGGWRAQTMGRHLLFYALLVVLAVWSSFGPSAGLYTFLYYAVPIFSFLRAPARFGVAVTLGLAVLAGFAVARLLAAQPPRRRVLVAAALIGVALGDLHLPKMPFREVPPPAPVYRLLRHLPPGVVVEFPFFYAKEMFWRHSWYMLQSTYHWKPLVNGYSDYIPRDFVQMAVPLSSFPNMEGFLILEPRGARYAVFHLNWYNQKNRDALLKRLVQYQAYLRPLFRGDETLLYEIVAWPQHDAHHGTPLP